MTRDFHLPGRSPVYAREGMAATSHPLASLAAIETLKAGGTAADAAITAVATLCVVEPAMTGIGGDCFCLVSKPGRPVWGYNGSGRAAAAVTTEKLLSLGIRGKIAATSPHAVTVPGAIEAWESILKAHGRFGLDRALQPAIGYADGGFVIAPRVGTDWAMTVEKLKPHPGSAKHYLPNGRAPAIGDVMRLPALAATLRAIAAGGARAFYEGPIAADIAATRGGAWRISGSRRSCAPSWRRGDTDQHQLSRARCGRAAAERAGPHRIGAAEHPRDIRSRQARSIRTRALSPRAGSRAARLRGARHAHRRSGLHARAGRGPARQGLRQKACESHRSRQARAAAEGTDARLGHDLSDGGRPRPYRGIDHQLALQRIRYRHLHREDRRDAAQSRSGFVVEPDHPNTIAPDKRPMHTIIPAMAMRDNRCAMSFGVMGADYQPMGHTHVVTNMVDYGMDVQAAIDDPRIFYEGDVSVVENGVSAAAVDGLKARGHTVARRPLPLGGGQTIAIDWERGVLIGGSDPRKDGCAVGY